MSTRQSISMGFQTGQYDGTQPIRFHLLNVPAGQDIGQAFISYMEQNSISGCMLHARGLLSKVHIKSPVEGSDLSQQFEGLFDIVSISGTYLVVKLEGVEHKYNRISVSFNTGTGRIYGGCVSGPLIAASPTQVSIAVLGINNQET